MPLSPSVRAYFFYSAKTGRGPLKLIVDGDEVISYFARCGSVGNDGVLKNATPLGMRYICDKPVLPATSELDLMTVKGQPGFGWKQRLWPRPVPVGHERIDGILIHPDGSKGNLRDGNGSDGCAVFSHNGMEWYDWMADYWSKPEPLIIPIEIGLIV
jgi:hypothetical protein